MASDDTDDADFPLLLMISLIFPFTFEIPPGYQDVCARERPGHDALRSNEKGRERKETSHLTLMRG